MIRQETVTDWQGKIVNRSKNLAGILKFTRGRLITQIYAHLLPGWEGELVVHVDGGYHYRTHFASYQVLLEWLSHRHSWEGAPVWVSTWPANFHLSKRQMVALLKKSA